MKGRFPPILVFLGFALLMYGLDRLLPVGEFEFFGRRALSIVLGCLGLGLMGVAVFQFRKARTSLSPLEPASASVLVTTGVFRFSRNPMYLSMLLLLLGWGLWMGNAFNTLPAALFVGWMNHFQIRLEEQALQLKFGKRYTQYLTEVRRWF